MWIAVCVAAVIVYGLIATFWRLIDQREQLRRDNQALRYEVETLEHIVAACRRTIAAQMAGNDEIEWYVDESLLMN